MSQKFVVVYMEPAHDIVEARTAEDAVRKVKARIAYGARVVAYYPHGDEPPPELAGLPLPGTVKPVA